MLHLPPPPPVSQQQDKQHKYENNPYCFHIISDFITTDNIKKLEILESNLSQKYPCKIQVHIINDDFFKHLNSWGFNGDSSHTIYYRILIDRILPKDIEKILYIDTDMLVLSDIREIFKTDLKDKILASSSGSINVVPCRIKFKSLKGDNKLTIDFKQYFCSGLMLINMPQWRAQNAESKCISFLQDYEAIYPDQDTLNYVAQDNIDLSSTWGVLIYQYILNSLKEPQKTRLEYQNILSNVKIIHCNGPAKPWSNFYFIADSGIKRLVFDTWWENAMKTQGFIDELSSLKARLESERLNYCMHEVMENLNVSLFNLTAGMQDILHNTRYVRDEIEKRKKRAYALRHPHKALRNLWRKLFSRN